MSSRFWDNILRYLGSTCILCYEKTARPIDLCGACEQELPWLHNACPRCALPFKSKQVSCEDCLVEKRTPSNFFISAPFLYQFPIQRLITRFKFQGNFSSGYVLGSLLAAEMQKAYTHQEKPEIIIPVPLHPNRLKKRGFNQALELAKVISDSLLIPYDYWSCRRVRDTLPQNKSKRTERLSNVYNAFETDGELKGKRICLIDDVVTTGETVIAVSQSLYQAGVKSVDVWCCARSTTTPP